MLWMCSELTLQPRWCLGKSNSQYCQISRGWWPGRHVTKPSSAAAIWPKGQAWAPMTSCPCFTFYKTASWRQRGQGSLWGCQPAVFSDCQPSEQHRYSILASAHWQLWCQAAWASVSQSQRHWQWWQSLTKVCTWHLGRQRVGLEADFSLGLEPKHRDW